MGNDCSGACMKEREKEIKFLSNSEVYSVAQYMISQKDYTLPKRIDEDDPANLADL